MSVWGTPVSLGGGGGGSIKGFEVYSADNKGGTRKNTGKMPNGYFVCFFHDNMSDNYKLNGTTYSYPVVMNGYGSGIIKAETKAVSDNINRGVNAELDNGSAFETTHDDSGSYISVVGGWVGYGSGGTVYKNAVTGTVNSITLNRAHKTLLVFVGGSARGLSQDTIDINGDTYTITNIGAMYDAVYSVYGAIEIDNNSDTVIEVTFPSSCYNFVSIIGI